MDIVIHTCEVMVRGKVESEGRDKTEPKTWVRFSAMGEQLAVVVPDEVMPVPPLVVGDEVEIQCLPSVNRWGIRLVGRLVHRVGEPKK